MAGLRQLWGQGKERNIEIYGFVAVVFCLFVCLFVLFDSKWKNLIKTDVAQ